MNAHHEPAAGLIRGLVLTVLRPDPDMARPAPDTVTTGAKLLTVTHLADMHTGQSTLLRPIPAGVPNASTLLLPGVPLFWLARRSPGHSSWALIPALDEPQPSQQQIDRHARRWTAGGNYASTQLSGLRELMGDQYFYGAIAIHDQLHWSNT